MKQLSFIFVYLFIVNQAITQDFYQNNPSIRWQYLKTDHFKIIFPAELTSEAQRVANTLEYLHIPLEKSLNGNTKPWPLILSNNGAIANGYVSTAPRISEWYTTPPQGTLVGTGEWYNLLASHEGRHMVQFDKMNQGFTKFAGIFLGQQAQFFSFFAVPGWFWEGDAVGTETGLSETGRGRIPEFSNGIKSILLEDVKLPYHRSYLTSYTFYRPNVYELGYQLTTHVKHHFAPVTWGNVLDRTSQISIFPWRFSNSLKKYTGSGCRMTYKNTMKELDSLWTASVKDMEFTSAEIINHAETKCWTSYTSPHFLPNRKVAALKNSFDQITSIITIDLISNEETKIKEISAYDGICFDGNIATWNEYEFDHRWMNENYSNIVTYNFETGKTKHLTKKGRFFSPSICIQNKKIAAVEFTKDRQCFLVIMDAETGKIIQKYQTPDNAFLQTPTWSEDGKKIVFTAQKFKGKTVLIFDPETQKTNTIIPEGWENVANPIIFKNFVLYESPFNGIDNIYAIDTVTKQRYQITSRQLGAYTVEVSPDGQALVFSDYDYMGNNIGFMMLDESRWKKIEDVKSADIQFYKPLVDFEQGRNLFDGIDSIPKTVFPVKKYNQTSHLINIHSWTPDPFSYPNLNISVSSMDLLNTMPIIAGIGYNLNEKKMFENLSINYQRFYPVFSLAAMNTGRYDSDSGVSWNERSYRINMTVPWQLSRGIYSKSINCTMGAGYYFVGKSMNYDSFTNNEGEFIPVDISLDMRRIKRSALRDIIPDFAQLLNILYQGTPLKGDYSGNSISVLSTWCFPGFFRNNGFLIEANIENRQVNNYRFGSMSRFSRGYTYENNDLFGIAGFTYHFPIKYPEFNIGSLIYINRIRGNIFGDYAYGKTSTTENYYRSIGVSFLADCNVLKLPSNFNFGIEAGYAFDDQKLFINPLFLGISF